MALPVAFLLALCGACYGDDQPDLKLLGVKFSTISTIKAKFELNNILDRPIKDLHITCYPQGQSGTAIRAIKDVIYERFPAHSKRNTAEIDLGWMPQQASKITCYLKGYSWAD